MKRVNNIYNKINDIDIINDMYKTISRSTKNKSKIYRFNDYYSINIINIKNIIESKNYIPSKYNIFLIREPKIRIIMSQILRDKVINHLVAKYYLIDNFDSSLIDPNVATRKNKGTYYGLKLTKSYINDILKRYKTFYILKFDVSKYFYNIDHSIVKKLIRDKIKDIDAINLIDRIIDSTNLSYVNKKIEYLKKNEIDRIEKSNLINKEKLINEVNNIPLYRYNKGLPIGNMTSQIIATFYLNELDHFIKEKLHIKYYIRYMDDGIIIHENKEYLKFCLDNIKALVHEYKLTLNSKTKIFNSKEGFEFLGFRFIIRNDRLIMKIKNQTKKRFKRSMKNLNKMNYKISKQIKDSYLSHLKYGDTNNLIFHILNKQ